MSINREKKSLHQPDSVSSAPTVPDPWQTTIPMQKTNTVPKTWHLPTEPNLLIGPAGNPKASRLVGHQSTSEEILLRDELKLQTIARNGIREQLAKALTLLYWMKKIGHPNSNWQMT